MTEYKILSAYTTCGLQKDVKKLLAQWYTPQGGIFKTLKLELEFNSKNNRIKFISCIVAKAISLLISLEVHIRIEESKAPHTTIETQTKVATLFVNIM